MIVCLQKISIAQAPLALDALRPEDAFVGVESRQDLLCKGSREALIGTMQQAARAHELDTCVGKLCNNRKGEGNNRETSVAPPKCCRTSSTILLRLSSTSISHDLFPALLRADCPAHGQSMLVRDHMIRCLTL